MTKKTIVRIETSSLCNLKCPMCPQSLASRKDYKMGYMEVDLFKRIVHTIRPHLGTDHIHLHIGGEPLLHPKIVELVAFLKEINLKACLVTNGTRLKEELGAALIKAGLHKISFSFEGFNEESFKQIRVGAHYERTKALIDRFVEINPPKDQPGHVITELRVVDLPSVDQATKDQFVNVYGKKFDEVKVLPYVSWMGEVDSPRLHPDRKYVGCPAPEYSLNILHDGRVAACCYDMSGKMAVGDLTKQSYEEIQEGEPLQSLIRKLKTGDIGDTLCSKCEKPWVVPHQKAAVKDAVVD